MQTSTASELLLRLYVASDHPASLVARRNFEAMCSGGLADAGYEVEIIDIVKDPARARADDIVAVPLLIKASPAPVRVFVGDLSDARSVLVALGVAA